MFQMKVSYGPKIDPALCTGCGKCYDMCPMDVFGYDKEKHAVSVDYAAECQLCCYCETVCPEVAIDVRFPLEHLIDFGIAPNEITGKSRFLDEA